MPEEDINIKIINSLSRKYPYWVRQPADMERWCGESQWSLREAVTLLIGFEPNNKHIGSFYSTKEYDCIFECLERDCIDQYDKCPSNLGEEAFVKPIKFVKWADSFLSKTIYLPQQGDCDHLYLKKCTANDNDGRVAQYKANLAVMAGFLGVSMEDIQSNETKTSNAEIFEIVSEKTSSIGNNKNHLKIDEYNHIQSFIKDVHKQYPKATSKDIIGHCFKGIKSNTRKLVEIKNIIRELEIKMDEQPGRRSNESRLYMGFGVFLTKTASNEDSKPFPRFLTLWTNSKKLRYSGNLACDMPRWGRSQERSSDQKPSMVFEWTSQKPSPSSSRAYSPAEWFTVLCG